MRPQDEFEIKEQRRREIEQEVRESYDQQVQAKVLQPRQITTRRHSLSDIPVIDGLAGAIISLEDFLRLQFGTDFSFVVCGKGRVLAASNSFHGRILPRLLEPGRIIEQHPETG